VEQERVRRPLTREAIVDAALELVDEGGLESLSMRRLGSRVGVEAMSLYNHVESKAALLDALVERLIVSIDAYVDEELLWTEALFRLASAVRALAIAHPRAFVLLATRPPATVPAIVRMEPVFATLARAGYRPAERVLMIQVLFVFLSGYLLAEVGSPPGQAGVPEPDAMRAYAELPDDAPYTREVAGVAGPGTLSAQFGVAVRLVIAGLATLPREPGPDHGHEAGGEPEGDASLSR
jgi:TetR/AcrR family transcriptional regulator, tetracycline repressor protein